MSIASQQIKSVVSGRGKTRKQRHMKSFLKPAFVSKFLFDKHKQTENCELCGAAPGMCKHKQGRKSIFVAKNPTESIEREASSSCSSCNEKQLKVMKEKSKTQSSSELAKPQMTLQALDQSKSLQIKKVDEVATDEEDGTSKENESIIVKSQQEPRSPLIKVENVETSKKYESKSQNRNSEEEKEPVEFQDAQKETQEVAKDTEVDVGTPENRSVLSKSVFSEESKADLNIEETNAKPEVKIAEFRKSGTTQTTGTENTESVIYQKMNISTFSSTILFFITMWNSFASQIEYMFSCCKCRKIETQLTALYRDSETNVENQFDMLRIQQELRELNSYLAYKLKNPAAEKAFTTFLMGSKSSRKKTKTTEQKL